MNNLKIKFNPLHLFIAIMLVLLPISLAVEVNYKTTWLSYIDEVLAILSAIYLVITAFKRRIKGLDLALLVIFCILSLWTLLGNAISQVITNKFPIAVDLLALSKVFLPFLAIRQIAAKDKKGEILKYLLPISKLFLITSAICGTISMFYDIGMTGDKRYGIPAYAFVFVIPHYLGYIAAGCLLVIFACEKNKIKNYLYSFLFALDIIYTTKGVDYVILVFFILLLILWRKNDKFNFANISILAIGAVITSQFQIKEYLTDTSTPRMILIKYGIKTANTYFPFGAGFATYGSDMAARNYSSLYIKYGFKNVWGLSQTYGSFLNDGYLCMLFGEFGYIGTALFIVCFGIIFSMMYKIKLNKPTKALSMAIVFGLLISTIGSAILRSGTGIFVLSILAIVCGYSIQSKEINEISKEKINS